MKIENFLINEVYDLQAKHIIKAFGSKFNTAANQSVKNHVAAKIREEKKRLAKAGKSVEISPTWVRRVKNKVASEIYKDAMSQVAKKHGIDPDTFNFDSINHKNIGKIIRFIGDNKKDKNFKDIFTNALKTGEFKTEKSKNNIDKDITKAKDKTKDKENTDIEEDKKENKKENIDKTKDKEDINIDNIDIEEEKGDKKENIDKNIDKDKKNKKDKNKITIDLDYIKQALDENPTYGKKLHYLGKEFGGLQLTKYLFRDEDGKILNDKDNIDRAKKIIEAILDHLKDYDKKVVEKKEIIIDIKYLIEDELGYKKDPKKLEKINYGELISNINSETGSIEKLEVLNNWFETLGFKNINSAISNINNSNFDDSEKQKISDNLLNKILKIINGLNSQTIKPKNKKLLDYYIEKYTNDTLKELKIKIIYNDIETSINLKNTAIEKLKELNEIFTNKLSIKVKIDKFIDSITKLNSYIFNDSEKEELLQKAVNNILSVLKKYDSKELEGDIKRNIIDDIVNELKLILDKSKEKVDNRGINEKFKKYYDAAIKPKEHESFAEIKIDPIPNVDGQFMGFNQYVESKGEDFKKKPLKDQFNEWITDDNIKKVINLEKAYETYKAKHN